MESWAISLLAWCCGVGLLGAAVSPWLLRLAKNARTAPLKTPWYLTRSGCAAVGVITGAVCAAWASHQSAAVMPGLALILITACGASLVDAASFRLPDVLVLRGWAAGAVFLTVGALAHGSPSRLVTAIAISLGSWAVFASLAWIYPAGIGYGDVKLTGMLALATGWWGLTIAVAAVIGAFTVGGLIGVALMASKRARGSTPIPFGPALVLAAALAPLALG